MSSQAIYVIAELPHLPKHPHNLGKISGVKGMKMSKRKNRLLAAITLLGMSATSISSTAFAEDTIKIGVLHSLSGTMAISETTLKDTVEMLVEQQNAKGGLLGKQLERKMRKMIF